ncbi:MAG: TraB/GumN family protein [Pseudomonadota bacterium]
MHTKRKLLHALTLLLIVVLAAPLQAGQALLWRVETPQGQVSHLFGTIHSEDARVLELPPPVEQAFAEARTVVLEMRLTDKVQQQLMQAMMLPPGQALRQRLPPDLYRQSLTAMAERGYPEAFTERLRPWAITLILNMPPSKTGQFLDKVLSERALSGGKRVVGLERPEEQLAVFTDLSGEDQRQLLRQTLADYRELPPLIEAITTAWLARDLARLEELNEETLKGLPEGLAQRFEKALIDERNRRMAERATTYLQQGGAFIAVGTMHLVGPEGLVALLRKRGLEVDAVY